MTVIQQSIEHELTVLTQTMGMNPSILRVGIAISECAPTEFFIPSQIVEITGISGTQVLRNLEPLTTAEMITPLPRPRENAHLRPFARLESDRWEFFQAIKRQVGMTALTDLFDKGWEDVQPWLRLSSGTFKSWRTT